SGMFAKARTGQYPSETYLGSQGPRCNGGSGVQPRGQPLDPIGNPLQRCRQFRRGGILTVSGFGPDFLITPVPAARPGLPEVIGKEQGCIKKLHRVAEAPKRMGGIAGAIVDHRGDRTQLMLFTIGATDRVTPSSDLDVDIGHQWGRSWRR